jgi:hypothetical protein
MRALLRILSLIAAIALWTGCAEDAKNDRPNRYQGGQFYGDAVHSADLSSR